MYSKLELLQSEAEALKANLGSRDATVSALSEEKTKLVVTIKSLEDKLSVSTQTVRDLQQKCEWMNEKLETLRVEKSALEKEKDGFVLRKSQEKMNLEQFAKELQELQDKLDKESKMKEKSIKAVNEMEKLVEKERKSVEKKNKEIAEMEAMFKLADDMHDATVKEKEGKIVELTFAYEDLRNKLEKEKKALEKTCEEFGSVKKQLKQAEERAEEMKEMYEGELDRVKFELRDSNNDCALLRGENEDLKRTADENLNHASCETEKKQLLHQLEEAKMRLNQPKGTHLEAEVRRLEEELEKARVLAAEKQKTANETLATNLRLVRKIEKLEKHGQQQSSTRINSGNAVEAHSTQRSQSPPKLSNNMGVFTPLAKSLAGLELKTLNTVPPVTDDARPDDKSGRLTSGRGLPTIPEAADSKKRAGEKCMFLCYLFPQFAFYNLVKGRVFNEFGRTWLAFSLFRRFSPARYTLAEQRVVRRKFLPCMRYFPVIHTVVCLYNRPFPNYVWLLLQSESWGSSFRVKIGFHS